MTESTPGDQPGAEQGGQFEQALREAAGQRARRRRLLAIVVPPMALAVGVSAWVWKPWQSVELPRSACWSVVTEDDLKPLAGDDGTAHVEESGDLSGQPPASCAVYWNDAKGRPLVHVRVQQTGEGSYTDLVEKGRTPDASMHPRPVDFGSGAAGVITSEANVNLVFRCDGSGTGNRPFRQVVVSGTPVTGDDRGTTARKQHVRLAWRVARAASDQGSCHGAALAFSLPSTPQP
ncbi:hypothetical protein [Kitasatospora sp. NPDC093558]|uniref:hypothetical protein n=1 Tax=Kitasatospora sp. NPDC093558 TaxID=3155201 RepID=UPI0034488B4E